MVAVLAPVAGWACAGCRNPSMPQSRAAAGPVDRGAVTLGVVAQATSVQVSHDAGCADLADCSEVPVQPAHTHELSIVPVELRVLAGFGVTERVTLELDLPVRLISSRAHYLTPGGEPYQPLDADVHHRNETLFGVSDAQLRARYARKVGEFWLTLRTGTSLPLGRTEPDPFVLGDAAEEHQHIQFGTGTFDPMFGVDLTRGFRTSEWSAYGQVQASLYENRHGFRGPWRVFAGLAGGWKSPRGVLLSLATEVASEGPERWSGVARSDGSLGRTELLVGPQMVATFGRTTLSAMLRTVVFRHIPAGDEDPGEIRSPVVVSLGGFWGV
jgi:hypothetical protein